MRRFLIGSSFCLALLACGESRDSKPEIDQLVVDKGRDLYLRHGCAVCHGSNGKGDGPIARTLNPKPRDFADMSAYKRGNSVANISQSLYQGISTEKGSIMPAYPHLSESDRNALSSYVVSLQP